MSKIFTPKDLNEVLKIPENDSSPVKSEEAEFIYNLIKDNSITRTLETGFAYAKSASHIMAASGAKHIACDPFQENYQNLGLENVKTLQMTEQLEFHPDFSHSVLPKLLEREEKFEFVFVDGDHRFDGELIDFYYADLMLDEGGYILLHDTWMRTTRLLMSFIDSNKKNYKSVPTGLRNLALYKKTGTDKRGSMHFREFYTLKSFLSHWGIMYMSSGKSNFLKRALFRLKEIVK